MKKLLISCAMLGSFCVGTSYADTIKVGAIIPLSGMTSQIGDKVRAAYTYAQDEINKAGGINGDQIEFIFADHQGKPAIGAREATRLINQEHVKMLTGSYESGVTLAVAQAAEKGKVPYLVPYSAANRITESGLDYTFRTRPPSKQWVDAMYEYLDSVADEFDMSFKTVGILAEDGAYGQGTIKDIENSANKYNKKVVGKESFHGGAQDLTTQLNKLKQADPDAILAASYLNDTMKALTTMDFLSFKRPYLTIGTGEVDPGFFQLGELAEGQVGTVSWLPDVKLPLAQEFGESFKEATGITSTDDIAYAYAATYLYKEAVEVNKSAEPEKVKDALENHEFTSKEALIIPHSGDGLKFDENGQANTLILVAQAQDGEWVTVWPENLAPKKSRKSQWLPGRTN